MPAHPLQFTDQEKYWLLVRYNSPDVQERLSSNTPRILETDAAGNPTKVKRGRQPNDGALKALAPELSKAYLEEFNTRFDEESMMDFKARKKVYKAAGVVYSRRRLAETQEQYEQRIEPEGLKGRIYRWLCNNSRNRVSKPQRVRITAKSVTPKPYTPYSTFRLSTTADASPSSGALTLEGSSTVDIGQWSTNLHQNFVNQTPEQYQELQQTTDELNRVVEAGLPEELMHVLREEKKKLLAQETQAQLHTWSQQTGFLGFIVMGGDVGGQVETFCVNNAKVDQESFFQHMCRRFKITEQQWQTELDLFFQKTFNDASIDEHEHLSSTTREPSADTLDPAQLPFTLANVLSTKLPPNAVEGPDPVGDSINVEPAYEAMDASVFIGDIYPEPQVPSPVEEEPVTESTTLVPPLPDSIAASVAVVATDPTPSHPGVETTTEDLVSNGAHGAGASINKRKGDGSNPPKKRSRTFTKEKAPRAEGFAKPDQSEPMDLGSRRSRRKIIPKVAGTAAYDEVVDRQQAARHKK